ncbi:hypothetical protein [uncultured Roseobacter sp.]|uniref:Acg family FMN-binding oxidoreductase n=1 Tax=uncultured Roseobacter sp. TaxID=114847 RepID=UPI002636DEC0|nr:hypothetical protein [uncultured Roseobacter sp.]
MAARQAIEALVAKAIEAPSSHNSQPWIFEATAEAIRLYADRTRALSVNDPNDRELTISCGCALMNLRAAAAEQGRPLMVSLLPDKDDPDLLAEIGFDGQVDEDLKPLARHISPRRTYRKKFEVDDVSPAILEDLIDAAAIEGVWFDPLLGTHRAAAVALVSEGDAAQWSDPQWRREVASWMHPRRRGEGLPIPWLALPAARLVVRSFDMGKGFGAKHREIAQHSPILAVLGTQKDRVQDWLSAGQGLERVLLTAAKAGLQASYLNQPVQVAHLRAALQSLCQNGGVPQILLRLGYPMDDVIAAPRRPLSDVLKM